MKTKIKIPTTYVLRCCAADRSSRNGFVWPESGPVVAPDWDPIPEFGRGLHGWARGEGDVSVSDYHADPTAKWLVVRVRTSEIVDLKGKVKFPRGTVVYCGDRDGAVAKIKKKHPVAACVYGTSTSGYGGTSTSGYGGTSTSGDRGTSTSGYGGTSTSGYGGTSTSGYGGTSTSGVYGTSTSGYGGTSTSGYGGTSTSGDRGTGQAGANGIIFLSWWDNKIDRCRMEIAYVGENGIKPDTKYRLDEKHKFVEVVA
jgi:hypothetical protein